MADNGVMLVQAVYSFKGKNNDELCFSKGDIITVSQKEEGGWWEGTLEDKTGWFPSNYVKEYKQTGELTPKSPGGVTPELLSPQQTQQQQIYRSLVLKDIIESEKGHVAEVQQLKDTYLNALKKSDILTDGEYKQLVNNLDEVITCHGNLVTACEEQNERPPRDQRIGGAFLKMAPQLQATHKTYCGNHPRAVCILEKYKDELNTFMESEGATRPGIMVLTTSLSKPFRRLDKYAGMMQEYERHIDEGHPDRGDTQRSSVVYRDLAALCGSIRRQKELELEVVTGRVHGWDGGESLATLGEVICMGSVALLPDHRDRYLVLFPATLVTLAVSPRMSAFIFEGNYPLTAVHVNKLEDGDHYKNAFEVSGPGVDRIVAVCQTKDDQQHWVETLSQQVRQARSQYPHLTSPPPPPPAHVSGSHSFVMCMYCGLPCQPEKLQTNTKNTSGDPPNMESVCVFASACSDSESSESSICNRFGLSGVYYRNQYDGGTVEDSVRNMCRITPDSDFSEVNQWDKFLNDDDDCCTVISDCSVNQDKECSLNSQSCSTNEKVESNLKGNSLHCKGGISEDDGEFDLNTLWCRCNTENTFDRCKVRANPVSSSFINETIYISRPYTILTKFIKNLYRRKIITRELLRTLAGDKYDLSVINTVRLRRHKTECSFVTEGNHSDNFVIASRNTTDGQHYQEEIMQCYGIDRLSSGSTTPTNSSGYWVQDQNLSPDSLPSVNKCIKKNDTLLSSTTNSSNLQKWRFLPSTNEKPLNECISSSGTSSPSLDNPYGYVRYYNPDDSRLNSPEHSLHLPINEVPRSSSYDHTSQKSELILKMKESTSCDDPYYTVSPNSSTNLQLKNSFDEPKCLYPLNCNKITAYRDMTKHPTKVRYKSGDKGMIKQCSEESSKESSVYPLSMDPLSHSVSFQVPSSKKNSDIRISKSSPQIKFLNSSSRGTDNSASENYSNIASSVSDEFSSSEKLHSVSLNIPAPPMIVPVALTNDSNSSDDDSERTITNICDMTIYGNSEVSSDGERSIPDISSIDDSTCSTQKAIFSSVRKKGNQRAYYMSSCSGAETDDLSADYYEHQRKRVHLPLSLSRSEPNLLDCTLNIEDSRESETKFSSHYVQTVFNVDNFKNICRCENYSHRSSDSGLADVIHHLDGCPLMNEALRLGCGSTMYGSSCYSHMDFRKSSPHNIAFNEIQSLVPVDRSLHEDKINTSYTSHVSAPSFTTDDSFLTFLDYSGQKVLSGGYTDKGDETVFRSGLYAHWWMKASVCPKSLSIDKSKRDYLRFCRDRKPEVPPKPKFLKASYHIHRGGGVRGGKLLKPISRSTGTQTFQIQSKNTPTSPADIKSQLMPQSILRSSLESEDSLEIRKCKNVSVDSQSSLPLSHNTSKQSFYQFEPKLIKAQPAVYEIEDLTDSDVYTQNISKEQYQDRGQIDKSNVNRENEDYMVTRHLTNISKDLEEISLNQSKSKSKSVHNVQTNAYVSKLYCQLQSSDSLNKHKFLHVCKPNNLDKSSVQLQDKSFLEHGVKPCLPFKPPNLSLNARPLRRSRSCPKVMSSSLMPVPSNFYGQSPEGSTHSKHGFLV